MMMKKLTEYFKITLLLVPCFIFSDCRSDTASAPEEAEIIELTEYETFLSTDDAVLATPNIIRYSGSSLFVYDAGHGKVLELDDSGSITNEFGRPGRGPGELQMINNFFLIGQNLYIVDTGQYLIHQYDRGGDFITSVEYMLRTSRPNAPSAPFSFTAVMASDLSNQPFVTLDGNLMVSAVQFEDSVQSVYELKDLEENTISPVGEVPEGSSFLVDYEKLKSNVADRVIPSLYRSEAFPVHDRANPEELFLVYTAFPKVGKYNQAGEKLWETALSDIPEIESHTTSFFENMERMQQRDIRNRIGLHHYHAGISSEEGELFLITGNSLRLANQILWVHQLNVSGELTRRYKLISDDEEVNLMPIFDIDFIGRRIFVVTEEAEIRAYSF